MCLSLLQYLWTIIFWHTLSINQSNHFEAYIENKKTTLQWKQARNWRQANIRQVTNYTCKSFNTDFGYPRFVTLTNNSISITARHQTKCVHIFNGLLWSASQKRHTSDGEELSMKLGCCPRSRQHTAEIDYPGRAPRWVLELPWCSLDI